VGRGIACAALAVPALALLLAAGPPASAGEPSDGDGTPIGCSHIPNLLQSYLHSHLRFRKLTPEIEARTAQSFLERFDASRSLLRASEAAALRESLAEVFDEVESGDCSALHEVHQKVVERHREAEEFVRKLVTSPDYAVDEKAELVLDPEERGRPATAEERDALLTRLVHFQMANYLTAGTELAKAKERLVHRYELRSQRAADLDEEDLYSAFLDAFASSLDPHSNYLSAQVLEDFRIGMSLSLEGIGVALAERDGYSVVERIIPGGAADRAAALEPKDKIIAVAEGEGEFVDIIDMPLRDAVSLIRGEKGTEVRLTVLREGEETRLFSTSIVRDTIDLEEQAAKLRFVTREKGERALTLAVLELPSFYGDADPSKRQSTDDVARLLEEARKKGADGLLLDLSRNSGGLLDHAIAISGYFIRRGPVVGVRNARGQREILADRDERTLWSGPLVVHTSRLSASAAEILAGALKDYRRAVIAGDDHTFGKGTVQAVSTLPPGLGALKVTTAIFFRPGGVSTQHDGVGAHVVIPSPLATDEVGERNQEYSLPGQRIHAFAGHEVNGVAAMNRWKPVTDEIVEQLARRSEIRVSSSPEFAEMSEELARAAERNGRVTLAEIIAEREENGGNGDEPEDPDAEPEPTPQLREAVDVLADLVALASEPRSLLQAAGDGT